MWPCSAQPVSKLSLTSQVIYDFSKLSDRFTPCCKSISQQFLLTPNDSWLNQRKEPWVGICGECIGSDNWWICFNKNAWKSLQCMETLWNSLQLVERNGNAGQPLAMNGNIVPAWKHWATYGNTCQCLEMLGSTWRRKNHYKAVEGSAYTCTAT